MVEPGVEEVSAVSERLLGPDEANRLTPGVPRVVVDDAGTATICWSAPQQGVVGSYRVLDDLQEIAVVPARVNAVTLTLPSGTHFLQVQAVDPRGRASDRSRPAIVTVGAERTSDKSGQGENLAIGLSFVVALLFAAFVAISAAGSAAFCGDWSADPDCGDSYRTTALAGLIPLAMVLVVAVVRSVSHRRR